MVCRLATRERLGDIEEIVTYMFKVSLHFQNKKLSPEIAFIVFQSKLDFIGETLMLTINLLFKYNGG